MRSTKLFPCNAEKIFIFHGSIYFKQDRPYKENKGIIKQIMQKSTSV